MYQNYRDIPVPSGRIFAVGDIHGCHEEAGLLLEFLQTQEKLTDQDVVVFIGDYVDRGPSPKIVVEKLLEFKKTFPATIFLCGNHEEMLLTAALRGEIEETQWIKNGGIQTMLSYNINADTTGEKLIKEFLDHVPPEHQAFYGGLEKYAVIGDYCFAHAGVNPLRDLRAQVEADLLWIRQEFIENIHYFKKTVVFGHTPFEEVLFHLPYKIGIDTGLVFGNKLTAINITEKKLIQIKRGEQKVDVKKY